MASTRKTARRKTAGRKASARKGTARSGRWSARVTKHSNALDLEKSVFKSSDPHRIALSLKRSAGRSKRRKTTPYQSAMSMLNFYLNRGGKGLPQRQVRILERAKGEGVRSRLTRHHRRAQWPSGPPSLLASNAHDSQLNRIGPLKQFDV